MSMLNGSDRSVATASAPPSAPAVAPSRRGALSLFLAFALGYFLSALLRAVTATLAPQFSAELNLSAADLGLLAGVFFAGFAAMQLPLGAALDRHGPKRVLLAFMAVAVLACGGFALARSFEALLVARTLMGVGLSASLMAALTSFRHAYAPEAQLRASSWMLMTGSLGMLTSTLPVHALLPLVGWRGLFWLSAFGLALCAALIAWWVPADRRSALPGPSSVPDGISPGDDARGPQGSGYGLILRHPVFIQMAPIGFWHYGGLVAVQALWAGPWLTQVAGLDAAAAAQGLFLLNLGMLVSFATLGAIVPRLNRWGWTTERLVLWVSPLSAVLLLAVALLGPQAGAGWLTLWCVSCVILSLCQPAVGQAFEARRVGRALSAYNLIIFTGIFCVQWGLGLVIDALMASGWTRPAAHQGAFGVLGLGCLACYAWFLLFRSRVAAVLPRAAHAPVAKGAE